MPIQTLQDLTGAQGKASAFYVKLDDPNAAQAAVDEIKNVPGLQTYVVRSMNDYLSAITPANTPGLSSFIRVVIGISVIIGFMVIFQAMYTAVMERTREIGILKSIGASKFYIVNVIMRETVLLAIGGIITGIVFSELMRQFVLLRFWPLLEIDINLKWLINSTIIAIVGALVGAVYPAFKAARKDPIEALAYE